GAGRPLADTALVQALRADLLRRVTVVTPNLPEAQRLSDAVDASACARHLLAAGARWVLITGTHEEASDVTNRLYGRDLYGDDGSEQTQTWPRLPDEYHGSGCTLASAIAARLALGLTVPTAVAAAQAYTWTSLARAFRTGRGQLTPNRLFDLPTPADTGAAP
uniref:bifunctional hydroxymethylpyrimidine kinase/phosphomethylpyrimidine kinase n=1 Tax=uncultured Thiodictyon sp. TaxID=1846217 RepID=UPI0025FB2E82